MFSRIFGENLVPLAQKMAELFNLTTQKSKTEKKRFMCIYIAPMELKIIKK